MILKDVSFFIKKIFLSEKYQLKKRIIRSINQDLEEEMRIVPALCSADKISLDVGVFRGVYSYLLSKHSLRVVGFEANPIMFKYLERNLTSIIKNLKLYNLALSNEHGDAKLKIPLRKKSFFKFNFEDYYEGGMATIHPENILEGKEINTPAVYSVSKSAVIGLSKYLASYWGKKNIRVNTLIPGGVESGQNETFIKQYSDRVPLNRMAKSHEMEAALLFLSSDASSYVTGQNFVIDGGLSCW